MIAEDATPNGGNPSEASTGARSAAPSCWKSPWVEPALTVLYFRTPVDYTVRLGKQCDPSQGHIPVARNLDVGRLFPLYGLPEHPDLVGR